MSPIGTAVTRQPRTGGSRAHYTLYALRGTGRLARALVTYTGHWRADGTRDERRSGQPTARPVWVSAARLLIHRAYPVGVDDDGVEFWTGTYVPFSEL